MIFQRLSATEAAELAECIGELAAAGLPLAPGLRAAADDAASRRLAGVLRMIAADIERGTPLDQSLAALDRHLPAYVQGSIRAGVRSGALPAVLSQLVQSDHTSRQLGREIRLALAYPLILLAMMIALLMFVVFFVLPQFEIIYADFETELPALTEMLLGYSRLARALWASTIVRIAVGALAGLVGVWLLAIVLQWCGWSFADSARTRPAVRLLQPVESFFGALAAWPARVLATAPLVGPIFLWQATAEWARLVALLVDARVPLPEALDLAAQGSRSTSVSRLTAPLANRVRAGDSLGRLIENSYWLPASLGPLVEWGNKSGTLAESLRTAADMFEGRVRLRASLLKQVGPPVLFILVASFVSFIVAAMFLPLIKLIQTLS